MVLTIAKQLRFKKVPISAYDTFSETAAWFLIMLIAAVANSGELLYEGNLFSYLAAVAVHVGVTYFVFNISAWWLGEKGFYDNTGNLWGLFVTTSTIDMIIPLFPMMHPVAVLFYLLFSLAVFFNALKSGLELNVKTTVVTMLLATVAVFISTGVAFFAVGLLAWMLGLSMGS